MKITVFTDYACPFCYIGHQTMENLKAEMDSSNLEVEYVYMEIHLEVPQEGIDTEKIISGPLASFNEHIKKTAQGSGITPQLGAKISNSKKAIITRAFVECSYPEKVKEFDEAVYHTYLILNEDIGDEAVLEKILKKVGIEASLNEALNHTMANIKFEMDRSRTMASYIYEIPTFMDGEVVGRRISGAITQSQLKAFLEAGDL